MRYPLIFLPALMLSLAAVAAPPAPAKPAYPTSAPPAAELSYAIRARQGGLSISGESEMHWLPAGKRYTLTIETRAMLVGKILDEKSEGAIDAWGLAPASYTEKRFRKGETSVTFNREAKLISFSASERSYPIRGGEQDRASVIWQLSAAARAAPAKFRSGSAWNFFVVGQRDADPWTFKVGAQEKVPGPDGDVMAWHVTRNPPPGSEEQQLDIWLAPSLHWYPVKLRFTEGGGDFIEQTLRQVRPK
ncbi:DUF3108 domain-containing protein [Noviherbaspirillum suwonense]|uniref:DUF3108 domain-containing protein n=1 Tax=Noviherbaspirillum suwonense TaxID=1224511 RepID=A0ABY1QGX8_9BURK|nr:DUF3108 domain-containing protein [Noviherbaspirillum suwonense]SMP68097.1 Protein of unknown function [Noviherbaspirillum suwonense]